MASLVISDVVQHPYQPGILGGGSSLSQDLPKNEHGPTTARLATSGSPARRSDSFDTPMNDAAQRDATLHTSPQPQKPSISDSGQPQPQPVQQEPPPPPPPGPRLVEEAPRDQSRAPPFATPQDVWSAQKTSFPSSLSSKASPQPSTPSPNLVKVRDLAHIQSFALEGHFSNRSQVSRRNDSKDVGPHYEISAMPITDIIEMVAGILTKITTTNDQQHEHLHRQMPPLEGASGLSQQTASVLAFHGKNVPSITILSYLARIHKYCPTTYEVFLSLLVYFDRMTERVNSGPMQSLRQMHQQGSDQDMDRSERSDSTASFTTTTRPPSMKDLGKSEIAPSSSNSLDRPMDVEPPAGQTQTTYPSIAPDVPADAIAYANLAHFFVVDSFNIHRLVIAGVTCASKFFSDIFYTNSRYAKVGGLPLVELNHLELQFLLLNDFRLAIPAEEMEAYGTMLVEFYAREVIAQQRGYQAMEGMYSAA